MTAEETHYVVWLVGELERHRQALMSRVSLTKLTPGAQTSLASDERVAEAVEGYLETLVELVAKAHRHQARSWCAGKQTNGLTHHEERA